MFYRMKSQHLVVAAAVAAVCSLIGCQGETGPSHPKVTGSVTYQGAKVEGATVTFRAKDGSAGGSGRTDADGVFSVASGLNIEGLPAGDYIVTVKKVEFSGGGGGSEEDADYDPNASDDAVARHLLPEKYAKPSTTDLTVTVADGENDFPLELQD